MCIREAAFWRIDTYFMPGKGELKDTTHIIRHAIQIILLMVINVILLSLCNSFYLTN